MSDHLFGGACEHVSVCAFNPARRTDTNINVFAFLLVQLPCMVTACLKNRNEKKAQQTKSAGFPQADSDPIVLERSSRGSLLFHIPGLLPGESGKFRKIATQTSKANAQSKKTIWKDS